MQSRHMNEIRQALQHKMDDFNKRIKRLEIELDKKLMPHSMRRLVVDEIVSMRKAVSRILDMIVVLETLEAVSPHK
jgi:hypothetical protein